MWLPCRATISNLDPTRNYDAASFGGPFPSFVAVRYFKVRPTAAHLISRADKRFERNSFAAAGVILRCTRCARRVCWRYRPYEGDFHVETENLCPVFVFAVACMLLTGLSSATWAQSQSDPAPSVAEAARRAREKKKKMPSRCVRSPMTICQRRLPGRGNRDRNTDSSSKGRRRMTTAKRSRLQPRTTK